MVPCLLSRFHGVADLQGATESYWQATERTILASEWFCESEPGTVLVESNFIFGDKIRPTKMEVRLGNKWDFSQDYLLNNEL